MKSVTQRIDVGDIGLSVLFRPIEAFAFWTAIVLPFLHVPLLVYGLETPAEFAVFFGLLTLNVIAFVVGHGHQRT